MADDFDWWPYWFRIWRVADTARRDDAVLVAAGSTAVSVACVFLGAGLIPRIGALVGTAWGVVVSLGSLFVADRIHGNRVYNHLLAMTDDQGKQYAKDLYWQTERYLSSLELRVLMRNEWPLFDQK